MKARWAGGFIGEVELGGSTKLSFALPKDFGGVEGYPAPEELLAASLLTCYSVALWRALSSRGLELREYYAEASLTAERSKEGRLVINKISVQAKITPARGQDEALVRRVAEAVKEYCPIGLALKGNVEVNYELSVEA